MFFEILNKRNIFVQLRLRRIIYRDGKRGVKVLSLNDLNRREIDIIEDITNAELHWWKRNKDGGPDLYYDDYDVMGEPQG